MDVNDGITPPPPLSAKGTEQNDVIRGTSGDDNLLGHGGDDTLIGGDGNDTLDGGAGADSLIGGRGDDLYIVDNPGDVTIEKAGEGTDSVEASLSWTLAGNVENLTLTGTANIRGTGNNLNNILIGNSGDNILDAREGDDTVVGGVGLGNDLYIGGLGNDTVRYSSATQSISVNLTTGQASGSEIGTDRLLNFENIVGGAGNDKLTGSALANTLTGGQGDDNLNGGAGNDMLDGGAGEDTASYTGALAGVVVNLSLSSAQNTVGAGSDTLISIEHLMGGNFNDKLTGHGGANALAGLAGNDTLDGGEGNDTLDGGLGLDTASYAGAAAGVTVNLALTTAQDTLGAGSDTLKAIEHLTGSSHNDSLTGNSAANTLTGGAGDDTLDGGAGIDKLIGGAGNDTYILDNALDVVVETGTSSSEIDSMFSKVSQTLGANLENLRLTGASAINGTGNALKNTLTGNDAVNLLNGGLGDDTLAGGGGNDKLTGGAGNDVFRFVTAGEGIDTLTDFTTKQDKIQVVSANFGDLAVGVLSAGNFVLNGAASGAIPTFLYDSATGALKFDLDGTGAGAAVQIATLTGPKTLAASDIQIVAG